MTKEEAITILCAIDVPEGNNAFIDKKAHQAIQMAIDALSIEHASGSSKIPKELEEAAEEYAKLDEEGKWKDGGKYKGFIAGAEWDKEQMLKEAVDAMVTTNLANRPVIYLDQLEGLKYGDKVRIIIVKEDEK